MPPLASEAGHGSLERVGNRTTMFFTSMFFLDVRVGGAGCQLVAVPGPALGPQLLLLRLLVRYRSLDDEQSQDPDEDNRRDTHEQRDRCLRAVTLLRCHAGEVRDDPRSTCESFACDTVMAPAPMAMTAKAISAGVTRPRAGSVGVTMPAVVTRATVEEPWAVLRIAEMMNGKNSPIEEKLVALSSMKTTMSVEGNNPSEDAAGGGDEEDWADDAERLVRDVVKLFAARHADQRHNGKDHANRERDDRGAEEANDVAQGGRPIRKRSRSNRVP